MIKKIKRYFLARKKMKLRKWCIEKAIGTSDRESIISLADKLYEWITK